MTNDTEWIERLETEREELADRYKKLVAFIDTNTTFKLLPRQEQEWLLDQSLAMGNYLAILTTRLNHYTGRSTTTISIKGE